MSESIEDFLNNPDNKTKAFQWVKGIERKMGEGRWFTAEEYNEKSNADNIEECKARIKFCSYFDYIISRVGDKKDHAGKIIHKITYDYQDHIDAAVKEKELYEAQVKALEAKIKHYKELKARSEKIE